MTATHSSRFGGLLAIGRLVEMPAFTTVFRQGDACQHYLWLLTGSVKVFSRSQTGKELLLYRVCAGQSCVLTTSCLLGHKRYPC
jgi:CRP/FNR family transcriptional regulator